MIKKLWEKFKEWADSEPDVIYAKDYSDGKGSDTVMAAALKAASEELHRKQVEMEKINLLKSVKQTKKNLKLLDEIHSKIKAEAADPARPIRG